MRPNDQSQNDQSDDRQQHAHEHAHAHDGDEAARFTQEFWDARYAESHRIWSGRPNARLVEHAADLTPGTAIDVGCGEGADVVWLAERGWQVTGVDVSVVALERGREHAEEAGVADRAEWRQVDVVAGEPLPGTADLVSAHYFHVLPSDFDPVYQAIAAAVRPGGTLLVAGHHPADAELRNPDLARLLFTPEQVSAVLDPDDWDVVVAEAATREAEVDGQPATLTDSVVVARRLAGKP